ncbi:unnamed protein product [Caenorhabditis auriculariae]|uniref:Uncharacterized protein n=1 Tax=Caenorhabditis auriculariae TaxID=2777116 RepID=A0A8S1H9K1_9PELO|nr:unnamed protein product [Caenorhabditis auriculariae]
MSIANYLVVIVVGGRAPSLVNYPPQTDRITTAVLSWIGKAKTLVNVSSTQYGGKFFTTTSCGGSRTVMDAWNVVGGPFDHPARGDRQTMTDLLVPLAFTIFVPSDHRIVLRILIRELFIFLKRALNLAHECLKQWERLPTDVPIVFLAVYGEAVYSLVLPTGPHYFPTLAVIPGRIGQRLWTVTRADD